MQRDNGVRETAAERFRTTHDIVGIKGEPQEDSLLRSVEKGDFEQFARGLDKLKNHLQDKPKEYQKAMDELSERLTKGDERGGLTRRREQLDPGTAGAQLTRLAEYIDSAENGAPTLVGSDPVDAIVTKEAPVVLPPLPQVQATQLPQPTTFNTPKAAAPEPTPKTKNATTVEEATDVAPTAVGNETTQPTPAPNPAPAPTPQATPAPEATAQPAVGPIAPTTKETTTALPAPVTALTAANLIATTQHALEKNNDSLFPAILASNLKDLPPSEFKLFLESTTKNEKEILPLVTNVFQGENKAMLSEVLSKQMPQAFERAQKLEQAIDRYWFNDQETFTNTLAGVGNTPEEKKQSNEELKLAWQLLRDQKLEDAIGIELDPERVAFARGALNGTNSDAEIVQANNSSELEAFKRFLPSF